MQQRSPASKRRLFIIIALVLAVQAICLCCVSVAFAGEEASRNHTGATQATDKTFENWFSDKVYTATHSRAAWLVDLMTRTGEKPESADSHSLYREAQARGIVGDYPESELFAPLTRDFVSFTLCRALRYPDRTPGYLSDVPEDKPYLATAAYFGYFLPDINFCVHPDAQITPAEYEELLTELDRREMFCGKRVLAFGDSIMHGSGNGGSGIARMFCEKYGMICVDYSVPGATMGVAQGRRHIPDQVRSAASAKVQADIILLNGGTNDMFLTKLGAFTRGFDMKNTKEDTYTGGFERVMWMLKKHWSDVPVVYIRAHNMALGDAENEIAFGERGIGIAEKWGASSVDIYNLSGLDTEDPAQCSRYTYLNPKHQYICDSIHPNALCYAKFYFPYIAVAVTEEFSNEVSE